MTPPSSVSTHGSGNHSSEGRPNHFSRPSIAMRNPLLSEYEYVIPEVGPWDLYHR
jgi:hypothetical protein